MLLSCWLFPGAEANPHAENAILFSSFNERLTRHAKPENTVAEKGEETDAPLLEQYDADAADEYLNEAVKHVPITAILELKKKQMRAASPLYSGTIARRTFAWTVLVAYVLFIYGAIYYFVYFVTDNSTHLVDVVQSSIANAYTGLADAYQSATNPTSPQQVAELMTEFYELLADMGYYDRALIARPPHVNSPINKTLAAELHFSQAAIDMMEMLPYLNINGNYSVFNWETGSFGNAFVLHGIFADMRDDGDLRTSRDPYFMGVKEDGIGGEPPYMDPDYVCLSLVGEEGTMMVVNVRNMKMWTFQMSGNVDPATQHIADRPENYNWLSPEQYPSRLARDALRDYMNKFISLEWMPGGGYNGSWEGDEMVRLYIKNGWRQNFDVDAFNRDRIQWHVDDEERSLAEQPFAEVAGLARTVDNLLGNIARKQKEIAAIDAGEEVDKQQFPDVPKHRAELVQGAAEETKHLPAIQAELEKAREALKLVDPAVRKTREERVAKYGY